LALIPTKLPFHVGTVTVVVLGIWVTTVCVCDKLLLIVLTLFDTPVNCYTFTASYGKTPGWILLK